MGEGLERLDGQAEMARVVTRPIDQAKDPALRDAEARRRALRLIAVEGQDRAESAVFDHDAVLRFDSIAQGDLVADPVHRSTPTF